MLRLIFTVCTCKGSLRTKRKSNTNIPNSRCGLVLVETRSLYILGQCFAKTAKFRNWSVIIRVGLDGSVGTASDRNSSMGRVLDRDSAVGRASKRDS